MHPAWAGQGVQGLGCNALCLGTLSGIGSHIVEFLNSRGSRRPSFVATDVKHPLPSMWRRKRSLGAGQASKEAWALKVCLDRQRAITQVHPSYLSTMFDAHPA